MAEEVRISPDGTHILVTSLGPPSLAEMKQTLSKLEQLGGEHGINNVLVDSCARSGQPSVSEIYRGGKLLAETLKSPVRIAVIVGRIEPDHALFENVAVNRGAVVTYFQSEQEALHWLLGSES